MISDAYYKICTLFECVHLFICVSLFSYSPAICITSPARRSLALLGGREATVPVSRGALTLRAHKKFPTFQIHCFYDNRVYHSLYYIISYISLWHLKFRFYYLIWMFLHLQNIVLLSVFAASLSRLAALKLQNSAVLRVVT